MARKSKEAQKRSAAAKKGWETRLANKRSAAARKGWETRRARIEPTKPPAPPAPPAKPAPAPSRQGGRGGGGGGRVRPEPREERYAPEFEGLDDFYGGMDFGEEDEY